MSPASHLDRTLNQTIRDHINAFYLSLQGDNQHSLASFLGRISTLSDTVRSQHHKLQRETLTAVGGFANAVSTVVDTMFELQRSDSTLQQKSMQDIVKILDDGMNDLSLNDTKKDSNGPGPHPAYIKPSFQWLLSNLHNPYPPKGVKKDISNQTGCPLKDIDAWFIDARKRIGWNKLRKTKFGNKQEKIIAAATHVFRPKASAFTDDLTVALIDEVNTHEDFRPDFIGIAKLAKTLYLDRFPDLATSPIFDEFSSLPLPPSKKETKSSPFYSPVYSGTEAGLCYPTPEPSPSSHSSNKSPLSPRNVPEPLSSDTRKRRHESEGFSEDETRSAKRHRLNEHHIAHSTTPSRSPSPSEVDESPNVSKTLSPLPVRLDSAPETTIAQPSALKRKRRLSDGEMQGPPKRPHHALCVPRLQTVSDPFPFTSDDALAHFSSENPQENTQLSDTIPSPVNLEDPIPFIGPLDVDFHHYDLSPYNSESYHPETSTADLGDGTLPAISVYSPFDPLSFPDAFEDAGHGVIDTNQIQFALSDPINFQSNSTCDPTIYEDPDLLLLTPDYLPDSSSILGDPYTDVNKLDNTPSSYKAPILGNFNYSVPRGSYVAVEQEAKRARAQALRQELAQLVAEGL